MQQVYRALDRQPAYRNDKARFAADVGRQLLSKLTRHTHAFLSQPLDPRGITHTTLDLTHTLDMIMEGQDFKSQFILPWLTPQVVERKNNQNPGAGNPRTRPIPTPDRHGQAVATNPTMHPPFKKFVEDFHAANTDNRTPTINRLMAMAKLQARDLSGASLFHKGECRRWTLLGRCNCGGTYHRHTQLEEDRLQNIHQKLKEGMAAYIESTKRQR